MRKDNKKALYESIMTSVAREVKKVLNEGELSEDNPRLINEIKTIAKRLYNKRVETVMFNGKLVITPDDYTYQPDEEPLDEITHAYCIHTDDLTIEFEEEGWDGYNYTSNPEDIYNFSHRVLNIIYNTLKEKLNRVLSRSKY